MKIELELGTIEAIASGRKVSGYIIYPMPKEENKRHVTNVSGLFIESNFKGAQERKEKFKKNINDNWEVIMTKIEIKKE